MKTLTEKDRKLIIDNPNVISLTNKNIKFHPEFKVNAVKDYLAGKAPMTIFMEAGFDILALGKKHPKRTLHYWKNIYINSGEETLRDPKANKSNRPKESNKNLTDAQKVAKAEAQVKYLEAELEFVKKLMILEGTVKK